MTIIASAVERLEEEFGTLSELVRLHAAERPAGQSLVFEDQNVSYAELDAQLDRVASSLQRDGFKPGDVLAISASTSLAYVFAFLGGLRAGVAVAPLAPDMTAANLARMIADSGAKVLFLDQSVAATLSSLTELASPPRIALDDSASGTKWSGWLAAAGSKPTAVDVQPEDAFNIIYSSGTTGTPRESFCHTVSVGRSSSCFARWATMPN